MNNYENDKFNKVIKDKVNDIKIDIPDTLKNNILKTLDELPEEKKQAEKYIQSSSDNYSWYINFKYIYACICRKLTNNRGYF